MKAHASHPSSAACALLGLLALAVLPGAAKAADAEGCADLKPLPRLDGCVIQECSAKQHESFEATSDASGPGAAPLDVNINSLTYSCSASMDVERVKRELDAEIRKAGYQTVAEDKTDPSNPAVTARKGSHWLRWSASSEDGTTTYSLTSAENASEKFKAEACGQAPVVSPFKQCEVVECTSKAEDSVSMRTAQKQAASLTGNVQTLTLACPAIGPAQAFSSVEGELKALGFEILFSDREHPESAWMTGRAGKKWVELVSAPDGESVSYALTVVPSAEVLTAAKPEPAAVPVAALVPVFAPTPEPAPVVPEPIPAPSPAPVALSVAAPLTVAGFVPPKAILEVPLDAPSDRFHSITGDVAVNLLVDVSANGSVTGAVLTGRVTRDVLKLQSAAIDAVWRWRFEPARLDGRMVAAAKVPVQLHFDPRPSKPDPSAIAAAASIPAPVPTPPVPVAPAIAAPAPSAGFVAPKPVLEVPIEATHDRIYSVTGDVAIELLVDVSEDGAVTKAELTGHITKDVLKLQRAAIDAVWRWRFEPARQDGRIVAAAKIPVQMHFRGRPWRY